MCALLYQPSNEYSTENLKLSDPIAIGKVPRPNRKKGNRLGREKKTTEHSAIEMLSCLTKSFLKLSTSCDPSFSPSSQHVSGFVQTGWRKRRKIDSYRRMCVRVCVSILQSTIDVYIVIGHSIFLFHFQLACDSNSPLSCHSIISIFGNTGTN